MNRSGLYDAYCDAMCALEGHADDRSSKAYVEALAALHTLAEMGCVEAVRALAEYYNTPGVTRAPEKAYKWYYINASANGQLTEYQNLHQAPLPYLGPVGDFRNECLANALVSELGEQRVRELDVEATRWISEHALFFTDPSDDRSRR